MVSLTDLSTKIIPPALLFASFVLSRDELQLNKHTVSNNHGCGEGFLRSSKNPLDSIHGPYHQEIEMLHKFDNHSSSSKSSESLSSSGVSSRRELHEISRNEAVYGWSPADYPNPIHDPISCGIDPLMQKQDESQVNGQPLFLCDPSKILNPSYLLDVTSTMMNFTESMNPYAIRCDNQKPKTQFRTLSSVKSTIKREISNKQKRQRKEKVDFLAKIVEYENEITSSSSMELVGPIRIAVAIVDKVRFEAIYRRPLLLFYWIYNIS